jgi:hypothetical protein
VYWIHETRAELKKLLQPGEIEVHTTAISHEWWVRDARTDSRPDAPGRYRLTDNSCLQKWKIVSDTRTIYNIPLRHCFDLSGHCSFWYHQGECEKNPSFMHEQCSLTCNFCESDFTDDSADPPEDEHLKDENVNNDNETRDRDEKDDNETRNGGGNEDIDDNISGSRGENDDNETGENGDTEASNNDENDDKSSGNNDEL